MVNATELIKVTKTTKNNLDDLKQYPRETYEDVIQRLEKNARKRIC